MSNDMTALRAHLFETLQGLKANTVDIDTARAVNEVAKTLVDTAKVEVDYIRASGGGESGFLAGSEQKDNVQRPGLPNGITGIRRHTLAG